MSELMPIIVLAGSNPRGGAVPTGKKSADMLDGYKGALRLPNGKLLVQEVVERYAAAGRFETPIVVGPARVYADAALPCEVVNAEGSLATSLKRTMQTIRSRFRLHRPVAITACDILPTAEEITTLLERSYDPVSDCVFWGQMVKADASAMGAGGWKPSYAFSDQGEVTSLYPGHLVIMRPEGLRFEVTIRLLNLAYMYRNRPLPQRVFGLTTRALGTLFWQDLRNLVHLQAPVLLVSVPYHCLSGYFRYQAGRLSLSDFEQAFTKTFVHRDYHHRANRRPAVFAVTPAVSFAKDLDTRAELEEATRDLQ